MIELLRDLPYKTYIGLFISSLFASYWLVPRIAWLARGFRVATNNRTSKDYGKPILGGLAIGTPFIIGISMMLLLSNQTSENMYKVPLQVRGLFFGSCGILFLGLIKDIFGLPRPVCLILQIALGAMAYHYRFRAGFTHLAGIELGPYADLAFTVVWIVGLIYLFDLLQRFFRYFSSLVLLLTLVLLGSAFALDYYRTIMVCCLLSGSLLGHISHEHATRPVLGCTGSYFIGFILAVTTLQSGITSSLLGILLIGVTTLILTLLLTRRSPFNLPFTRMPQKQDNLYIKSLHHYQLATNLQLQSATNLFDSWNTLCKAASNFGYSSLCLQSNTGETALQWGSPDKPQEEDPSFSMRLSGGMLHLGSGTKVSPSVNSFRHASFSLIAEAFDQSREEQIRDQIDQHSAPHQALLINRYYRGMAATGQLVEELAQDLYSDDIEVTVLTGDLDWSSHTPQPGRNELADGVHIHRISSTQFGRSSALNRMMDFSFFYLSALIWILRTPASRYTHILTFTDPPLIAIVGYIAQKLKGWKFIYCVQDLFPDNALALGHIQPGPVFRFFQRLNKLFFCLADTVVAISNPMAAFIQQQTDRKTTVRQIPNWADGDKIKSSSDRSLLPKLGLQDIYTVTYAGNMGHPQGLDTLVEVLKICKNWDNIQFLFVGCGARRELIQEAITTFEIGNAKIIDYQSKTDLHRFLAVSDIGVVSLIPQLEGLALPSKTYSYFAAGLPILSIGARDSEIKNYAEQGLGAHFTPDDLEAILAFLANEAQNGSSYSRITIRQIFEANFARPTATAQYAALIKELADPQVQ